MAVAFVTALAVLFAQGLRLCIHTAAMTSDGSHHITASAAVHLESNLGSSDDASDGAIDQHVPLSLALVKLTYEFVFAVILTALLVFLLPDRTPLPRPFADFRLRLGDIRCLRPPLRAPPR